MIKGEMNGGPLKGRKYIFQTFIFISKTPTSNECRVFFYL